MLLLFKANSTQPLLPLAIENDSGSEFGLFPICGPLLRVAFLPLGKLLETGFTIYEQKSRQTVQSPTGSM